MGVDDFKLIYQPVPPDSSDEAFASALKRVVEGSESVAIASPYLSYDVLERLVNNRSFRLITDQDACFEARYERELVEFLLRNNDRVRTLAGLHAKVVLGSHAGLFGSANLTSTGLSRRFEMASIVRGHRLDELKQWFEDLWKHSISLNLSVLEARANESPRQPPEGNKAVSGLRNTGSLGWLAGPRGNNARFIAAGDAEPLSAASRVAEPEIAELATRLSELTYNRTSAKQVLQLFAKALEYAGLPVDDERLHLNFARPNSISITAGQRFIASCQREGKAQEFALMLQSFDVAERAVAAIPDSRLDSFSKDKKPDVPRLHVPLNALETLNEEVLSDWERSIRREVQRCGKSSYLKNKRESFYHFLRAPELWHQALSLAHPAE